MAKNLLETQTSALKAATASVDAQKSMIEMQGKIPSEHQNYIDMYSQMGDSVGFKQRPNDPWRAALDGLFKGLALGEKSKMTKEMKERYEKLAKPAEYLMGMVKSTNDAVQQEQKKANENEKLKPFAQQILNGNFSMPDTRQRTQFTQEVVDQLATIDPRYQGAKVRSTDENSPFVNYTLPNGTSGTLDLRSIVGEDTYDAVVKNHLEKTKTEIDQQNADAKTMRAETEATYKPTELHERKRRNDIAEINATTKIEALGMKSVKEVLPRLESSTIAVKLADDLIKDAKANPKMFGTYATAILNTKGDANALELWAQQNLVSEKERDTLMRMAKNVASLQLAEAKSLGGQNNMTLDSWMQQMFPNGQYSQSNFLYIMDQNKAKYEFYKDMYRDVLNQPANSYIGTAYDQRAEQLNQKSSELRKEIDNTNGENKFSSMKTEDLEQTDLSKLTPEEIRQFKEEALKRKGK